MFNSAALAETWEDGPSSASNFRRADYCSTEGTWGYVWLACDFGNPVSSGVQGSDLSEFIIGICGGVQMGLLSYSKTEQVITAEEK